MPSHDAESNATGAGLDELNLNPEYNFGVMFRGGQAGPEIEETILIPLRDLESTPYVCAGDGPYLHYVRTGEREYTFIGMCHTYPQLAHVHPALE